MTIQLEDGKTYRMANGWKVTARSTDGKIFEGEPDGFLNVPGKRTVLSWCIDGIYDENRPNHDWSIVALWEEPNCSSTGTAPSVTFPSITSGIPSGPKPEPLEFKSGDHVKKIGGDYMFEGIVVAAFAKLSGKPRYVVEDDRGTLHIFNGGQLIMDQKNIPKSEPAKYPVETGWVIEHGGSDPSSPTYWSGLRGWAFDNSTAIRFAREQDAQAQARHMSERIPLSERVPYEHRVTQHTWNDTPPVAAQPSEPKIEPACPWKVGEVYMLSGGLKAIIWNISIWAELGVMITGALLDAKGLPYYTVNWTVEGLVISGDIHEYDLLLPERSQHTRTVWLNVYPLGYTTMQKSENKAEADCQTKDCIARIEYTFTFREGDGL